jgi:hypothetical protein
VYADQNLNQRGRQYENSLDLALAVAPSASRLEIPEFSNLNFKPISHLKMEAMGNQPHTVNLMEHARRLSKNRHSRRR